MNIEGNNFSITYPRRSSSICTVRRTRSANRSLIVIDSGKRRGMAATQVFRKSTLGFRSELLQTKETYLYDTDLLTASKRRFHLHQVLIRFLALIQIGRQHHCPANLSVQQPQNLLKCFSYCWIVV